MRFECSYTVYDSTMIAREYMNDKRPEVSEGPEYKIYFKTTYILNVKQ